MAQTIISPSHVLDSPERKRSRLSRKSNKQLSETPTDKNLSSTHVGVKPKPQLNPVDLEGLKIDSDIKLKIDSNENCSLQDENASPNCSVSSKPSQVAVPDMKDSVLQSSVLGLPNCGNTCYINSILQVLRYTPNFLKCVHLLLAFQNQYSQVSFNSNELKEMEFFSRLHTLYAAMKSQEIFLNSNIDKDFRGSLLRPVKSFLLSLREVSSLFKEGEQHDAHELLLTMITTFSSLWQNVKSRVFVPSCPDSVSSVPTSSIEIIDVSDSSSSKKKPRKRRKKSCKFLNTNFPVTSKILDEFNLGFEGKICHIVQCLECEKKQEREETFTNLEVPITDSLISEDTVDLCQCLVQKTTLSGENKYFCGECCHLNEAQLSFKIVALPSNLLLHLSWLRGSSEMTEIEKDCMKVLIPMSLHTLENSEIFCCSSDHSYSLYAVVLHIGKSTEGGHYVSFIRDSANILSNIKDLNSDNLQSYGIESCCAAEESMKALESIKNRWLLFDDENVSAIFVTETENFPYFDYVSVTASPCMIFYYKM